MDVGYIIFSFVTYCNIIIVVRNTLFSSLSCSPISFAIQYGLCLHFSLFSFASNRNYSGTFLYFVLVKYLKSIQEVQVLKEDTEKKLRIIHVQYETKLQQEADALYTRMNEKITSLEDCHKEVCIQ